ncbi:MAG TPA: DNA polymerase III subunit gamma/tau, partial [Rectinemataceae bacterium]|nr:DNA polymerase III subunit gamma/tau [Rectinemataceae bacterium]
MPYEVTAARKRPQSFEQLAGQEFVAATLEKSLETGRIAHAYLFSGPRGCGKTSTARILAKALNCEKGPTAEPCGVCDSCKSITAGSSLDVIEIDGASNTSVENVRQIKDEVLFPPNSSRYKIYIIDEVHMLSTSAFNALLKTIEEPPPYVVFMFATTEQHKVPATIKSRCQQFTFRLVSSDVIKALLAAAAADIGVKAEDEALLWIARESGGSVRDAYTLFDQVVSFAEGKITAALIREKLGLVGQDRMNNLFGLFVAGNTAGALSALDFILSGGVSPEQFVADSVEYCRALLLLKNGLTRESLLGAPISSFDLGIPEALSGERIEKILSIFLAAYRNLKESIDPRYELDLAAAKASHINDYVPPSDVVRAVSALKRYLEKNAQAIAKLSGEASDNAVPRPAAAEVPRTPPFRPAETAVPRPPVESRPESRPEPKPEPKAEKQPESPAPEA